MKKFFQGAGTVLSNVAEVVAPTPKSPLESFKRHWNAIRNFYIDQKNDVESGNIPTHLHGLVQLMLEEDDERSAGDGAGPCVEYFMQNKLMETLCALCLVDRPAGIRRLILSAVTALLGNARVALLPHMSVHQPLSNLIAGMATMQLAGEIVDALALLRVCLNLVAADGLQGDFFLVVPPEGRDHAEYSIWTALVSLYKRTAAEQRDRIEELLLRTLNTATPRLLDCMMHADFHVRLVEDLAAAYGQLPKQLAPSRTAEAEQVYRYKLHVRFCNSLTSPVSGLTNVPNAFSDALLLALEENFLEGIVVASLKDESSATLARDTIVAKDTLQLCTGPLQDTFVSLTVGQQVTELRDKLCKRMNSQDPVVALATLRFFDVVCGLYHSHATESLVLSHIRVQSLEDDANAALTATTTTATTTATSTTITTMSTSGGAGGNNNSSNSSNSLPSLKVSRDAFHATEDLATCTFEPVLNSFPASYTQDRVSGSSLDSYTLHAKSVISQVAAYHAAMAIPSDTRRQWVRFDGNKGPFLDELFRKLRSFVRMPLKECLVATSLVSRLLTYPSRPLFECVAHTTLETVAMIAAECELEVMRHRLSEDEVKARMERAYATLANLRDFEVDQPRDELTTLFFKVTVLDEFVRELVGIDSARQVYQIEQQNTQI